MPSTTLSADTASPTTQPLHSEPCPTSSSTSSSSSSSSPLSPPLFQLLSPSSPSSSLPRRGLLLSHVPTPHYLHYTHAGLPPHLTVDNWPHLPSSTVFHLSISSFLTSPTPLALTSYPSPTLSSYLSYPTSAPLLLSPLDPALPPLGPANDASITLPTSRGNQRLTPAAYISRALTLSPHLLLLLSDTPPSPPPTPTALPAPTAPYGRERKAVFRTLHWLQAQLASIYSPTSPDSLPPQSKRQRRAERQSRPPSPPGQREAGSAALTRGGRQGPPYVLAPIPVCGDAATHRLYMQQLLAHQHLLDGYNVPYMPPSPPAPPATPVPPPASPSLAALGDVPPAFPVYPTAESIVAALPPAALRVSVKHRPARLSAVLEAVAAGVDLVSTTVAHVYTVEGRALGLTGPAVWLQGKEWERDAGPLWEGCGCFACRTHTRGYVHHLLVVKEMTALVLLDLHNWHVVGQLFEQIRERVGREDWTEWKERMMARLLQNEKEEEEAKEKERKELESRRLQTLQESKEEQHAAANSKQ